jgi:hypothetical protein
MQSRRDQRVRSNEISAAARSASEATQEIHEKVLQTIREGTETVLSAVRESEEETRRQMRVLHEDLVERIGRLGESRQ